MLLFLSGQSIRAIRWQILLPAHINIAKHHLLYYTSIGSLINIFIPFRIGDIIRAGILSKKEDIQFSTCLSSVIYERLIDIFSLFLISLLIFLYYGELFTISKWYVIVAILFICLIILLHRYIIFRKILYQVVKNLDFKVKIFILDILWASVVQIHNVKFLTIRFAMLTILMWLFLLTSYLMFMNSFKSIDLGNVLNAFHGNPVLGILPQHLTSHYLQPIEIIALLFFLAMPIIIAIIYSLISTKLHNLKKTSNTLMYLCQNTAFSKYGISWKFFGRDAYSNFLISHFSGSRKIISLVGVKGFADCRIKKFLIGGSRAVTAVVEKQGELSIRKAIELHGVSNLYAQYLWLQNERHNGSLPVVEAIGWTDSKEYSYYEMPLIPGSMNMYEWLKVTPEEKCVKVFSEIFDVVHIHHLKKTESENPQDQLILYLQEKVINNCDLIRNLLSGVLNLESFNICGINYSIAEWTFLYDINRLLELIPKTSSTNIHGDLTIENIILLPSGKWMLIDPNPVSTYRSMHMDWAKLLQSLKMGYEIINEQGASCVYSLYSVEFTCPKLYIYTHLNKLFMRKMQEKFSSKDILAIELHEIIHYIRLVPYKISRDLDSGILFFSITCILIRQFSEKYFKNEVTKLYS